MAITSARKVPFAKELIRLGLPDYVTAMRDAGEVLLFPELSSESGKGTMGDRYSKRMWSKIAEALPFLRVGQATDSFRHTAIDSTKGVGISPEIRADFAGHALQGETQGRYSKELLPLLKQAVEAIPVVTDHLEPFPTTLLPARLRAPSPMQKRHKIPLITCRSSTRTPPQGLLGSNGSITASCASVSSNLQRAIQSSFPKPRPNHAQPAQTDL
jgi:hypothetical protein